MFVNPVGTAFSRPDQPGRGPSFWTTAGDIASLGEFVRSFINTYDRRNSPLFLAGEDFGTGRVAGLANYLDRTPGSGQGVVLLSMTPAADAIAGDEQYITLLPSLVMAAWYHKKLAPELECAECRADRGTGAAVRLARVPARALQGRPHDAGGTRQGGGGPVAADRALEGVHREQQSAHHAGSLQRRAAARPAPGALELGCAGDRLRAWPSGGGAAAGAVGAAAQPRSTTTKAISPAAS